MVESTNLPDGYEIREMSGEEFQPLFQKHAKVIFQDNSQLLQWDQVLSEEEEARWKQLSSNMGTPFRLRLGLYHHNEFVGWTTGDQQSGEVYYMRNSAVLPEHRRKGLYSALLNRAMETLKTKGFQKIYSRHMMTNNAVIIPKLKAGFVITSFELSDVFGTLIHLTYFTNPGRRKVLEYRTGEILPDAEIKKLLALP